MASALNLPPYPVPSGGGPLDHLEFYESAVDAMRASVVDLEASPSFLMLKDAPPGTETNRKFAAAVSAARDTWIVLDAAAEQLRSARTYFDENGAGGRHGQELNRLLTESWFAIIFSDGRSSSTSVNQTLSEIRWRLTNISEAVGAVESLWTALMPRIDAARQTLVRLSNEANALDVTEPLISRADAKVDDLAERLLSDPLSVVPEDGPQLDRDVAAAAKQMAALRTGHDNLDTDLNQTEELLASLRVLRARAEAAYIEASTKIEAVEDLIRVPGAGIIDGPEGLAARLDTVFEKASSSVWTHKRSLLDVWLTTATKLEKQLSKAELSNRLPIGKRDELRGRLEAYQAKIAAEGKAEDIEFQQIVDRARSELFTAPSNLSVANAAIDDLAARLRE